MQVKQGETVLTESGDVYDTTLTGGRLGMLVFGQQDVIWSRLEARGIDRSVGILTVPQKEGMILNVQWPSMKDKQRN